MPVIPKSEFVFFQRMLYNERNLKRLQKHTGRMFAMEFKHTENRIFLEDETGKTIAEITFPEAKEGVVDIDRTFVDDSLRGQGVAGKLLEEAVSVLRASGKKAVLSYSYAAKWFEKHPEENDLLA